MRWWRRKDREHDLERELQADLELEALKQQERGLSPTDARYAAQRALGNATLLKENVRGAWGWVGFGVIFEAHVAGSLAQEARALRDTLQPKLPGSPVEVHALTEQVERALVRERLMATLAAGFGILGLILAAVGLYGLLTYTVTRRTNEIGIRLALGAMRREVLWMIVRHVLILVGAGVAIGLPVAWACSRLVSSMLFGVSATDLWTIGAATAVLAAAGLAAGFLPAWRASRVDPMVALRYE